MSAPMNVRVPKSEYDRWLGYLREQGFQIQEEHRGSMMDTVQVQVYNPEGDLNPAYSAMSFVDAERGRRVYAIQLRATTPQKMPLVLAAAASTPAFLSA